MARNWGKNVFHIAGTDCYKSLMLKVITDLCANEKPLLHFPDRREV